MKTNCPFFNLKIKFKTEIMRNLANKGLSMSQAQSISNLCNQTAQEIERELNSYNNCSKSINISGQVYNMQDGIPIPGDILEKLKNKGDLHACQAFLMEALKGKESELTRLRNKLPDLSHLIAPQRIYAPDYDILYNEEELWGWKQLSDAEYSEYLQAESMAAHLGQFIHKNGKLTQLRKDLPNTASIEWFEVEDGKKTPVKVVKHHIPEALMMIHENIADEHRKYEQRVNYFKAKVKNLVSDENARIQRENADKAAEFLKLEKELNEKYQLEMDAYNGEVLRLTMEFNSQRELDIKSAAALRISVDPRFQAVIDLFITAE
jgi:hypothetical protein